MCKHFKLNSQHRIVDIEYEKFIDHIRYWQPSQNLLDTIQEGQVVCPDSLPTDDQITDVILQNPEATVLTVSRRASARVNELIVAAVFQQQEPLAVIQYDNDSEPANLYKNMRVIITQNRDKDMGVVNGQEAIVHLMENATIFLRLPDEKIINVYPVTYIKNDVNFTCYPFMPSYSLTMLKSQGQTLKKVIIWFDSNKVGEGLGYVALSRIRRRSDLILITAIKEVHVKPVLRNT